MKIVYLMHPTIDHLLQSEEILNIVEDQIAEEHYVDLTFPYMNLDPSVITNDNALTFFRAITLKTVADINNASPEVSAFLGGFSLSPIIDSEYIKSLVSHHIYGGIQFKTITVPYAAYVRAIGELYDESEYDQFIMEEDIYDSLCSLYKEKADYINLDGSHFVNNSSSMVH